MLTHYTGHLMADLIELGDSTTLFLETLRGHRLQVMILSQEEIRQPGPTLIKRAVKLFFDSPGKPVLYCISYLNRNNLKIEEYRNLMDTILPIGLIFLGHNENQSIRKKNVSIIQEINPELADVLNVKQEKIFRKKYDYWVGDRDIGYICEFFNEESLGRI